jgi:hypothetical protein
VGADLSLFHLFARHHTITHKVDYIPKVKAQVAG